MRKFPQSAPVAKPYPIRSATLSHSHRGAEAPVSNIRRDRRPFIQMSEPQKFMVENTVASLIAGGCAVLAVTSFEAVGSITGFGFFGGVALIGGLYIKSCFHALNEYQDSATGVTRYLQAEGNYWKAQYELRGSAGTVRQASGQDELSSPVPTAEVLSFEGRR